MAALTTLALLAVSAGKTALNYTSQRNAASQTEAQGDAQANLIRQNATLEQAQAADAIARGDQQASGVTRQTRALGGAQRAAFAAQGVTVDQGSAGDVVGNDQRLGAFDALTIKNNAARAAWGYQTEAAGSLAQAGYVQAAARYNAQGIRRQSVGTLLSGAGELANIWDSAPKGVGNTVPVPTGTRVGTDPGYGAGMS